jgi:hypothetical protein
VRYEVEKTADVSGDESLKTENNREAGDEKEGVISGAGISTNVGCGVFSLGQTF